MRRKFILHKMGEQTETKNNCTIKYKQPTYNQEGKTLKYAAPPPKTITIELGH